MEKKEWIFLLREAKQNKNYHMLRTCGTAWLLGASKNLEVLWKNYTCSQIKLWFTMEGLYRSSLRILRDKKI